jgi:hypothetical protein
MSSQGSAGRTGYTGTPTRDSSDWTRELKEKRAYYSYSTNNAGNKDTSPEWMKFGNDFKLVYNHGKLECGGCTGSAFSGVVPLQNNVD